MSTDQMKCFTWFYTTPVSGITAVTHPPPPTPLKQPVTLCYVMHYVHWKWCDQRLITVQYHIILWLSTSLNYLGPVTYKPFLVSSHLGVWLGLPDPSILDRTKLSVLQLRLLKFSTVGNWSTKNSGVFSNERLTTLPLADSWDKSTGSCQGRNTHDQKYSHFLIYEQK